jgi:hypothetical protein
MKTTHKILFRNAIDMDDIADNSIDLMVASSL